MKNYLVADRYARGLDRAFQDDAERDVAAKALRNIGRVYRKTRDLQRVLANPAIPLETRTAVLDAIVDLEETPPLARTLISTMFRRGRISLLPEVAVVFSSMTDERMNRAGAQVTSAVELTDAQASRIVKTLESHTGMHVRADFEVDPEILGGIIARIRGIVIDGSLRARVQRLTQSLLP